MPWSPRRSAELAGTAALLAALLPAGLAAQRLLLRTYSMRDGLAHSRVNCVHQDRSGYWWIGTWEGLSRFDGRRFVNYGTADGLPSPFVQCIAEDPQGRLFVGTLGGGLACLREHADADGRKFESFRVGPAPRADDVGSVLVDEAGRIWLGTGTGVHRQRLPPWPVSFEPVLETGPGGLAGACDPLGRPWFVAGGRCLLPTDEGVLVLPLPLREGDGEITALLHPGSPHCLLAYEHALYAATLRGTAAVELQRLVLPLEAGERITALARALDGVTWVGTSRGLLQLRGDSCCRYDTSNGLPDDWIRCLHVDLDGELWIGTHRGGLACLPDANVVGFGPGEGLGDPNVQRLAETPAGHIYASTDTHGIHRVLDDRVLQIDGAGVPPFATVQMRFCCDHRGGFWLGTDQGLWHAAGSTLDLRHCRRLDLDDGLPPCSVFGEIHEARDGSLWFGAGDQTVYRRAPEGGLWQRVLSLRDLGDATPCRAILDLQDGGVLLASYEHLFHLRDAGCTRVDLGIEPLRPRCLLRDRRGCIWIGTRFAGAFVLPAGTTEPCRRLGTANGLPSDAVWSIAEDPEGRIHLGTGHGICRFDPVHERLEALASADVLPGEIVNHMLCDGSGRLWAATSGGLCRFDLVHTRPERRAPRILLTEVRVDGAAIALPETGAPGLSGLVLAPGQRSLEVGWSGLAARNLALRYEHSLTPEHGWSAPTDASRVLLSDLPPGHYRLRVRARDGDGRVSPAPVELVFTVQAPFWRQSWFLALVALAATAVVAGAHRVRLRRAVATERMRTQIATDLHDEVGAGLSQIAIQSEVVRRSAGPPIADALGEVAALARSLRQSMSDIVWALATGHDTVEALVQRLRQFATSLFEGDGTQLDMRLPARDELAAVSLSLEQRRALWLFCREALTNVARHAGAHTVAIQLQVDAATLRLSVRDDGRGFQPEHRAQGNGLHNLQRRCEQLGGAMALRSAPGAGTALELTVPLQRLRRRAGRGGAPPPHGP